MKNSFGYTDDKFESKGFIDQNRILQYVSEEEIYSLVFGFEPQEYQYVTSPLREDDDAGCWFENMDGKLFFRDFAYSNRPLDCFHLVKDYFKLRSFPDTLQFIKEKLIDNQDRTLLTRRKFVEKEKFYMNISTRQFLLKDAIYWKQFYISKQNLLDDYVFAVFRASFYNTKNGDTKQNFLNTICYAYTEFNDNRKKLYLPKRELKFISSCTKNDIGSINHLPPVGRLLVITKSYKDCRILRNLGYNSVWFQNEGMIPSDDLLYNLVKRFDKVIIFYDNDEAGMKSSVHLSNKINQYFPDKSSYFWLSQEKDITDSGDFVKKYNDEKLKKLLYESFR